MEFRKIDVSVIVPVYMEEAYIENCIKSLIEQEFLREKMEWIFVDGGSTDKTIDILKRYQNEYPCLLKYYDNPKKNTVLCNEYRN